MNSKEFCLSESTAYTMNMMVEMVHLQQPKAPETPKKQENRNGYEKIFQVEACSWINENWHFRSANGSWSPPRSPIKIQKKVINKPMRQIHPSKLTAWRANHQEALRIVCPRLFEKELSELEVAKLKALIFRKSRDISINQYLASRK